MTAQPRVLDPCCGSRMMWFDRQHPDVVFGDRRSEVLTVTDRSHWRTNGTRTLCIEPDVLLDFRDTVTHEHESKEAFIARVRAILGKDPDLRLCKRVQP